MAFNLFWSEDDTALLRALWTEGHSAAEIGRRMVRSKNAIIGRAHRLDLPGRPSPIKGHVKKSDLPNILSVPKAVHTLPPLPSEVPETAALAPAPEPEPQRLMPAVPVPRIATIELFRTIASVPLKVVRELPEPKPAAKPIAPSHRVSTCCWPIGDPGKPGFHFCDQVSVSGKPYCDAHCAKAYVRIRDRSEDVTV